MPTEKHKMLAGELYDPEDAQLMAERQYARDLLQRLNDLCAGEQQARSGILDELFAAKTDVFIQPPFYCDYGGNISLGRKVFFNFNCVILDVAPVTIGDYVLFGPNVQVYTATHPISPAERRLGLEYGKPVSIGSDVWVGGGAIICPGVTIGAGSVIAAGSVVTRDVPEGVVAVGNPCRVVRPITP